jgi:CheY-like chemotaxis protein
LDFVGVIIHAVILIVDDDAAVRFMLRLWLEELDQKIDEADSGELALLRCEQQEFDVVVLDQRMPPGMTGIDVARALKDRGYDSVVLLHSAYLDEDVEAQAAAIGIATVEKGDERGLRLSVLEALRRHQ